MGTMKENRMDCDDDRSIRWVLEKTLEARGNSSRLFDSAKNLVNMA